MTPARKRRIHASRDGKCWMCGKRVDPGGPHVVFDHRLPLDLGGTDDDTNIWPLHAEPCNRIKTASDRKRIDKARRQGKMAEPREPSRLQSRGFDKTVSRGFDGKVRPRASAGKSKHVVQGFSIPIESDGCQAASGSTVSASRGDL